MPYTRSKRSLYQHAVLLGICALLCTQTGCQLFAAPFLLWAPDPTRTVVAEYPYLDNKKIAILVWADTDTMFEFPMVQQEVADHVRIALEGTLKGVTVVPTREVIAVQRADKKWDRTPPAEVGKRFAADRVLMLELTQYTTKEPDSPQLLRGRITAYVKIYDTGQPDADAAYRGEVATVYPEKSHGEWGVDERTIRKATLEAFAQDVAGKFYDRKIKIQQSGN